LHRGGDGLLREIELLGDAQVTLLADRRETRPWGLAGGKDGAVGMSTVIQTGREEKLPGKCTRELRAGSRLRVESPGGGGWGQRKPR
jgi:N-methylhydantoinase B